MVFEYRVLLIDPSWNAAVGRENIENELNELGKEGWELVPITLDGYLLLQRAKKSDAKG